MATSPDVSSASPRHDDIPPNRYQSSNHNDSPTSVVGVLRRGSILLDQSSWSTSYSTETSLSSISKWHGSASLSTHPAKPKPDTTVSPLSPFHCYAHSKAVEDKRLALCKQRVELERRLLEATLSSHLEAYSAVPTTTASASTPRHDARMLYIHNQWVQWTPIIAVNASTTTKPTATDGSTKGTTTTTMPLTRLPTGYGRLDYADGQVYQGHVLEGLRNGLGRNTWPSSSFSSSSWLSHSDEAPWNATVSTNSDGSNLHEDSDTVMANSLTSTATTDSKGSQVYIGEWKRGERHGRGTHSWPDGRTGTGSWHRGHWNGRVLFQWPDGAVYDGYTRGGRKHGHGTHRYSDGRMYTGQYGLDGTEDGLGLLTEANGLHYYRGEFRNGARHGYGQQTWPNHKTYEGEWDTNRVHGKGKLVWGDTGATYTGEFFNGKYHGIGCYTGTPTGSSSNDSNGFDQKNNARINKYVGHWKNGVKEGLGKRYWSDGRVFEGSFRRNKPCGFGHMTWPDASFYIGGWKDGQRAGWGIARMAAREDIGHCGMWQANEPVEKVDATVTDSWDDCDATPPKLTHDAFWKSRCKSFEELTWGDANRDQIIPRR